MRQSVSGSLFAPISRQEAELIQQQAPPSYGQLIAQGIIPPVEDFPTENPNEVREKGTNYLFALYSLSPALHLISGISTHRNVFFVLLLVRPRLFL